jgi:arylsulfatase A-like enzyme
MAASRRAVFVCCDGLGRDWVRGDTTPVLDDLRQRSLWCAEHNAVFPSVTRVSAASIATGCHPARHGLHGNRMGLIEDGRFVVRDVGAPDFRTHMRRATGGTLLVPSIAERVADAGGFIAYSNVSPGAAYFLDPEHFGTIHHRAGSFAPGGANIGALDVTHDSAGDWAMTQRFCAEVLCDARPSVAFLWICDPDHTTHSVPLGSPTHIDVLRQAERCVGEVHRTVEQLRAQGEDILLLIGSDHGHETIGDSIDVEGWLASQGLKDLVEAGDVAVAGQGTAALLYATERGQAGLTGVLDAMRRAPWAADVLVGSDLARKGFAADGVVAAVDMARQGDANPYGVPGRRWVAEEGKPVPIGSGQHGGLGPDETRPFLMLNDGRSSGTLREPTCLVDIAPTIASFLGMSLDGFDGSPLEGNSRQ